MNTKQTILIMIVMTILLAIIIFGATYLDLKRRNAFIEPVQVNNAMREEVKKIEHNTMHEDEVGIEGNAINQTEISN